MLFLRYFWRISNSPNLGEFLLKFYTILRNYLSITFREKVLYVKKSIFVKHLKMADFGRPTELYAIAFWWPVKRITFDKNLSL